MEFVGASTGKKSTPKMPAKRQVLGLRVTSDSNQGGRDHMEDMISIRYERRKDNDCAFFGVFDGHGGKEAAVFARDTLWDTIKAQRGFESKDPEKVKQAISEGFLKTQDAMWKKRVLAWRKESVVL
ncbi:protein phosphatase 1D-like [Patiria miniata]|uniref:PPM-type phosphatase domain-containing protein n=1 Tax=Patiria miniata TaxID=46514 RepID=A0A914A4L1_PATMI|nr:protein phosphatase 1D-like [Patiria miniata]